MKILDCTLRDGGYYTNWDFSDKVVNTYFESFNSLPVDYVEIGYRSVPLSGYAGKYFYCPINVVEKIKECSNKQLAIILNEKDIRYADVNGLLGNFRELVTMVRLAVDPQNFSRSLELGKAVKGLGFEVSFNIMYMSKWHEFSEFMQNVHLLNGVADYLYMVDSYGGVFPADVRNTYKAIKEQCDVPIGFHGHNNLELALINTLTAIECGVDIIDATVTGMGRGAGNLKTELLLTTLNAKHQMPVDFNALSEVVTAFESLQQEYRWGANLPYMVSGAHSLPQKEVMEWVGKRVYSFNSIVRTLENRRSGQQDNRKLPLLEVEKSYSKAIVIGGGFSVVEHTEAVKEFIEMIDDACLIHASAKNAAHFVDLKIDQYFCLVGNEGYRLERVLTNLGQFKGICVLPPYPRDMGTYVPDRIAGQTFELPAISFVNKNADSHTAIATQLALNLGVKEMFFFGYDGYQENDISQRERELFLENEELFQAAGRSGLSCYSLLPTKYSQLELGSVYSEITQRNTDKTVTA